MEWYQILGVLILEDSYKAMKSFFNLFIILLGNNYSRMENELNSNNETISIFQMNTLAKSLCDSKSFPKVNEEYLSWEYRLGLMKDLFKREVHDIYTFEEIEDISDYLGVFSHKYKNIYCKKTSGAPGGLAFFYDSDQYLLLEYMEIKLPQYENHSDPSQSSLIVVLKKISNSEIYLFSVNHLKSKFINEDKRLYQINFLIKYLNEYKFEHKITGIVISGDFNAYPDSSTVKKVIETEFLGKFKVTSCFEHFDINDKNYIDITSCKIREKLFAYTIDYIFTSEKFKKIESRRALSNKKLEELVNENGLPSKEFPSDHLFITSKFIIS